MRRSAELVVADLFEKSLQVARDLEDRVAAEFFQKCGREFERHYRFRNNRRRWNSAYVGALDRADRLRLGLDIDRAQRAHQGGKRLERDANAERLAGAHSAFSAAGIVGVAGGWGGAAPRARFRLDVFSRRRCTRLTEHRVIS